PPLLLSPFPGPFTGLFAGRFPRRPFARLFQEPPRLPRRRLVHRGARPPQRLFDLAARLEQVGARLLARLALERLGARLHLALAPGDLLRSRVDPGRVLTQRRVPLGELALLRLELAGPRFDRGEQRVERSL